MVRNYNNPNYHTSVVSSVTSSGKGNRIKEKSLVIKVNKDINEEENKEEKKTEEEVKENTQDTKLEVKEVNNENNYIHSKKVVIDGIDVYIDDDRMEQENLEPLI